MDSSIEQKKIPLFDGEPDYEFLIEEGVMTKEEVEKDIKFNETLKKYYEAFYNDQKELAKKFHKELMSMIDN